MNLRALENDYSIEAQRASLTCFLNSLLREWFDWELRELPILLCPATKKGIRIPLHGGQAFWIALTRFSMLGRHEYAWPVYRELAEGLYEVVDFDALTDGLIETIDLGTSDEARARFRARVQDSLMAVREVLQHRSKDLDARPDIRMSFIDAEQYLVIGHSFHPSPKSREGFTRADRERYCPEYAGHFALAWFAVHPSILKQVSSESFAGRDWVAELLASDDSLVPLRGRLPEGFLLYPMHPWQALYLLTLPEVIEQKEDRLLIYLGEAGRSWYPTSSVRSIYRPESPFMLKTSLNVRLTNSVRSLLLREVDRGLQAHDVFASRHGKALLARYPKFKVIYEPAYWTLVDREGTAIEASIVICRENPFGPLGADHGLVLASLTQDNPFFGISPIEAFIEELQTSRGLEGEDASRLWFERYVGVVVEPLLMAQADFGILLGAHQQNILIAMKEGLPELLYFRDCQGTGYSELAYKDMKGEIASLDPANGNVLPHDMANALFVYYLIINASFNVINTIARAGFLAEEGMVAHLREALLRLLAGKPRDASCILHLLQSKTILHKGNFICSIQDINENTAVNPLAIYTAITNPLFAEARQ